MKFIYMKHVTVKDFIKDFGVTSQRNSFSTTCYDISFSIIRFLKKI